LIEFQHLSLKLGASKELRMQDGVILLHGILRTHLSMLGWERFFKKHGFRVLNLDYPSRRYDLDVLVRFIEDPIRKFTETLSGNIHFVGYSMGGLLVRAYLSHHVLDNVGRIVLVGVPNGGSEVADYLQHHIFYRWIFGPAGQQLITDQSHLRHLLAPINKEVGIIAGNRSTPPFGFTMKGKENDGKVSVASTHLSGEKDHIVLPYSHLGLLTHKAVREQALSFLEKGHFVTSHHAL
jgi:pimeloyl-ACP methyl ester carboxylesterase